MPEENQTTQPANNNKEESSVENKPEVVAKKTTTESPKGGLFSVMQVLRRKATIPKVKVVKVKDKPSLQKQVDSFSMAGFKDKSAIPSHRDTVTELNTKTETPPEISKISEAPIKKTVSPIRTFAGDVAASIKGGATMVSIAVAKEKRARSQRNKIQSDTDNTGGFKKISMAIGAGVLILTSLSLIGYFFLANYGRSSKEQVIVEENIPNLISTNGRKTIEVTNLSGQRLLDILKEEKEKVSTSLGSIYQIIPITTDEQNIKTVSTQEFLNSIGARVEPSFLRTLDNNFLFGAHVFNGNQPVLIFKTDSYDNAFAGMLKWEDNLLSDFSPLFDFPQKATSTISQFNRLTFKDAVVKNRDARAHFGEDGKIKLIWSIPDRKSIVITTNENSLIEAISRLSGSSF